EPCRRGPAGGRGAALGETRGQTVEPSRARVAGGPDAGGLGQKALGPARSAHSCPSAAGTPLFIKIVLEELRFSATHERLDQRIDFYLGTRDMPDLFARMLERLEEDSGADTIARLLAPVWASRAGLEESELIVVADGGA